MVVRAAALKVMRGLGVQTKKGRAPLMREENLEEWNPESGTGMKQARKVHWGARRRGGAKPRGRKARWLWEAPRVRGSKGLVKR